VAEPSQSVRRPSVEDTGYSVRRVFERSVPAGTVVFDEGETGDALYVIQSGQVELTRARGSGRRLVARLGPGDFFGEMTVLLGRPRSHRAAAVTDLRLLQIDVTTFEAMCVEQPEVAIRMIQRLAARAIDLEQRLAALGVDDLLRPVVRVLLRRASPAEDGARLPTTLRKLSREAGLSLLEAHRALGQLLDRKLVRLVDDVLVIPDLEALSASLDARE
jgi:CRP-like cAMP-binding protein